MEQNIIPALPGQRAVDAYSGSDPDDSFGHTIEWAIADVIAWRVETPNGDYSYLDPMTCVYNPDVCDSKMRGTEYIQTDGTIIDSLGQPHKSVEDWLLYLNEIHFNNKATFNPPLDTLPAQYRKKQPQEIQFNVVDCKE